MGSLPPVEPPDLRNRRPNRGDDDDYDDNYPPRGDYPPPGNYPPPGGQDPHYGQPPSYPPPRHDYPPQGQSSYPPPGSDSISLDDPRRGGQTPRRDAYPPPPPPDRYPPQQPGPVSLDDPRHGGTPRRDERRPRPQRDSYDNYNNAGSIDLDDPRYGGSGARSRRRDDARVRLDDDDLPDLGRDRRSRRSRDDDDVPQLGGRSSKPSFGLSERQVEYLAWGSTVLLLGISLMMVVGGSSDFLTSLFPLLAGAILMGSALYQRVVMGWHVGPLTWLMAILLVSYTVTLQIAGDTGFFKWIVYFIGTLIIMTGVILLMQVFRKQ